MPAYILAQIEVTDEAEYDKYKPMAAASVAKHGGRYAIRGPKLEPLEGQPPYPRVVLLEFKDRAAALAFYHSPDYAAAKAVRQRASRGQLTLLDLP